MDDEILRHTSASILLIQDRTRTDIVIGAPHHAPGGVKTLPCETHPDSDENTGFIAYRLAEMLECASIIACNYRIDPNKYLDSDYTKQIEVWQPRYLIEIHGHGGKNAPSDAIEISSGNAERNEWSIQFAETLQERMHEHAAFAEFEAYGDFEEIYFKAKRSVTITHDAWIPFHVELPRALRIDVQANRTLPQFTDTLVKCLAETIRAVCV